MSKISELSDGGSLLPTDYLIAVRSGGNVKVQADTINVDQIDLGDNEKIRLGNSQDLQIYHDGSHSRIDDAGTGKLILRGNDAVEIHKYTGEYMITAVADGAVTLYHDDSAKLATTSTGIDVTGTLVSDGLTVSPSGTQQVLATLRANSGAGGGLVVQTDASDDGLIRGYDSSGNVQLQFDTDGGDNYIAQGNVGIGHASPGTKLDVNGAVRSYVSGGTPIFYLSNGTTQHSIQNTSGALTFFRDATEAMRIDAQGQVRLSNTTPVWDTTFKSLVAKGGWVGSQSSDYFYVGGQSYFNADWKRLNANAASLYEQSFGVHKWYNTISGAADSTISWAQAMTLDASGNLLVGHISLNGTGGVDIGTSGYVRASRSGDEAAIFNRETNDGTIVSLQKDGTTVGSIGSETSNSDLYIGNGDTAIMFHDGVDAIFPHNASTNAGRDAAIDIGYSSYRFKDLYLSGNAMADNFVGTDDTDTFIAMTGSNVMRFFTGNSEAARFDSSGNLLVGTPSSAGRFCVEHSSTSTPAGFFNNPNSGTSGVQALGTSLPSTANNTNCYHLKSTTQGVASYYLYGDGSSSFTSDERQKKNIVTTRDGYLDDLKNLRVVDYHWNNQEDTEDKNIGLIAQEVEQIFPHLIVEHELEGAGVRKNLKGSDFTFILIKAIQEQQDLIESLTARIAQLEGAN